MSSLITFLSNLRLSLSQWLLVTLASIVGGLVVALRVQGGALHRAQLAALKANMDSMVAIAHKDTIDAVVAYHEAKEEYDHAKK